MVLPETGDDVSTPPPAADDATPPPAANVTPAPAIAQPVSPPTSTSAGSLQPVGLIPLALGGEPTADRFAAKVRWRVPLVCVKAV